MCQITRYVPSATMIAKTLPLLLIVIAATAVATEETDDPCTAEGGGVMAGYICVAQQSVIADAQLNAEYQKALKRTEEEERALREVWAGTELVSLFRAAQRAWLTFRDAECQFIGISSTPSPWQSVQVEECKLRMTNERIAYFKGVHSS